MSTTIKTGWLKDKEGNKFAPKTLTSQVQTSDGVLLEDKIQADLETVKTEILKNVSIPVDDALSSTSENPVQNKVLNTEFEAISTAVNVLEQSIDSKANASHSHTITASASDDDIVVLTGTNGINGVTYSASHADSTVNAGTYKSVTVDNKGHVTSGTNPTTLEGYGITNAYNKDEIDAELAKKSNTEHTHIASEITDLQPLLNEKVSITTTINGKELGNNIILSASDVDAYSKVEINNFELITTDDIDAICGGTIKMASEVTF